MKLRTGQFQVLLTTYEYIIKGSSGPLQDHMFIGETLMSAEPCDRFLRGRTIGYERHAGEDGGKRKSLSIII